MEARAGRVSGKGKEPRGGERGSRARESVKIQIRTWKLFSCVLSYMRGKVIRRKRKGRREGRMEMEG